MVDVVSSFSLLNLPNNALMNVLHNMEIVPKIALSILSERTKHLVKSLNLEARYFSVHIKNVIYVFVEFSDTQTVTWNFLTEEDRNIPAGINDLPVELPIPHTIKIECYNRGRENETYEWNNQTFGIKQWIDHLTFLFNQSKINSISFGESQYDVELLHDVFKDYMRIWISSSCSNEYSQSIFKIFLPVRKLFIEKNPFENPEDIHNVFTQNFDYLSCVNSFFRFWPDFGLNDMLMINSLRIRLSNARLSNKAINGFIKHWINGSNPRMKYLDVIFLSARVRDEALDENVILKGVMYTNVPPEQERVYGSSLDSIKIKGGFDFQRNDGTNATIVIKPFMTDPLKTVFEMFVWN